MVMAKSEEKKQAATDAKSAQQFMLQKIYVKDSSFESPNSPAVFQQNYAPKVKFNISSKNSPLQDDLHEVVLQLTIEVKQDDKVVFVVEVHQAGIFLCKGFEDEAFSQVLSSVCPGILFPYAREVVDGLAVKGGFPALMLAPVNFDALYQQAKKKEQEKAEAAPAN